MSKMRIKSDLAWFVTQFTCDRVDCSQETAYNGFRTG